MTLGRIKGNAAEREVANRLAVWWKPVEDAKFVRTPLSGGWGGKEVRAEFRASGDLMTTAKKWPFVVEVKRREGWSWKTFLAGKPSPIWGWWQQTVKAANEMGGQPLLIFRKNREPWSIMVSVSLYVRARGRPCSLPIVQAWYPSTLGARAAGVLPICTGFKAFLDHGPEAWIAACGKLRARAG